MSLRRSIRASLSLLPLVFFSQQAAAQSGTPWPDNGYLPAVPDVPAVSDVTDARPPAPPQPPRPPEPPAPRFGAPGELVFNGGSSAWITSQEFDGSDAAHFSVGVDTGIDYFVLRDVSIGLGARVSYADGRGYDSGGNEVATRTTTVSAAPRLGVNIPLGSLFSFYPRVAFGLESEHSERAPLVPSSAPNVEPAVAASGNASGPWVSIFAPLLLHPAPHLFVGAGPSLSRSFTQQSGSYANAGQGTTINAGIVIGGWWGGTPHPSRPDESPATMPGRRFGEAGEWVLTNEAGASLGQTTFSGNGGSSWSASLEPGFDYFVVDQFSVGLNFYVTGGGSSSSDANGVSHSASSTSFGLAPHLGVNVPLARGVSFYPRAYIGLGTDFEDRRSGAADEKLSGIEIWTALYAPVLVHPASHFFVGFGPSVNHELSNSISFPDYPYAPSIQNRSTVVGASLIVGGWL